MRPLFTTADVRRRGITESALRWGLRTGRWRRVAYLVYAEGPELGLFIELDGEHHARPPVCVRFTWTEVVRPPRSTARRPAALAERARRRPPGA